MGALQGPPKSLSLSLVLAVKGRVTLLSLPEHLNPLNLTQQHCLLVCFSEAGYIAHHVAQGILS